MASFPKELRRPSDGGVLIPNGSVSELTNRKKTNLLHVKARAKEIEDLSTAAGVAMSPTCGLAQLILSLVKLHLRPTADRLTEPKRRRCVGQGSKYRGRASPEMGFYAFNLLQ